MLNILIVDDNFVNRKLLIEILAGKAHCDTAVNGAEAIEAYNHSITNEYPYDIILLDIAMPGMDGLEVLKLIREAEQKSGVALGQGIPIIMVTAHKKPFADSFRQGCDDYLLRPIEAKALLVKIETLVGQRRAATKKGAVVVPEFKRHVLVIDDEQDTLDMLAYAFGSENVLVGCAKNASEALDYIKTHHVHVVITDIVMPDMNGIELFYELRKVDPFLQIIMITAYPSIQRISEMLEAGACDFVMKPFDISRLKKMTQEAFSRAERWRSLRGEWIEHVKRTKG